MNVLAGIHPAGVAEAQSYQYRPFPAAAYRQKLYCRESQGLENTYIKVITI